VGGALEATRLAPFLAHAQQVYGWHLESPPALSAFRTPFALGLGEVLGGVLLVFPGGLRWVRFLSPSLLSLRALRGAALTSDSWVRGCRLGQCAYRQFSSTPFVPLSVESFGRLGAPAVSLLGSLADVAVQAGGPGLSLQAFILGALREASVALCRGSAWFPAY
jgi:hypothetical protein